MDFGKVAVRICAGAILALLTGGVVVYFTLFSSPQPQSRDEEVFTIVLKSKQPDVTSNLKSRGFIRSVSVFDLLLTLQGKQGKIESGGYFLNKNMNAWQIAHKLTSTPDMKWVVIPEGLRKEEIGEILAKTFIWDSITLEEWNNVDTTIEEEYIEGVYYPDTYLLATNSSGTDIAKRMTIRFNEKFAPYLEQFAEQDIIWTTGLKLASIVQREAAGKEDMPLIAGILWNRLLKGMKLEIDATVQYARGRTDQGWWAPIKSSDITEIDSLYNTYQSAGLPPHPICNLGTDAIEAVLNPIQTDCLYYLHDNNRQIHCAVTFKDHQANIEKYLRNQ